MSFIRLPAAVLAAALVVFSTAAAHAEGRYVAPAQESASTVIAADAAGGLHVAFTGYTAPTGDAVYYAACAAQCETAGNWRQVTLKVTAPTNVQIATTPDGKPRLLITRTMYSSGAGKEYDYAACDADCLEPRSWSIVPVANGAEGTFGGLFEYKIPEHSFAVDAEGRPHFIYVDTNYGAEPDHYGTFHLSCESACTDPENWLETDLALHADQYSTELWDHPAIATAPGGKLRVVAKVYAVDPGGTQLKDGLYYYACDANCADRAGWTRTRIIDTGYGSYPNPTWDIEALPDGQPRVALFAGSDMEQQELGHELLYLWCDKDCGTEQAWYGHAITAPGDGESPDLALTADGHPRLAFLGEYGDLGTLSCDRDCESDHGEWQLKLQDASADAAKDRPTARPFTCDGELWNGTMPRLALAGGKPWFAYDLTVNARCLYKEFDSDPTTSIEFHEIWRGGRLSY